MAELNAHNFDKNGEVIMVTITLDEYRELVETSGRCSEIISRSYRKDNEIDALKKELDKTRRELEAYRCTE